MHRRGDLSDAHFGVLVLELVSRLRHSGSRRRLQHVLGKEFGFVRYPIEALGALTGTADVIHDRALDRYDERLYGEAQRAYSYVALELRTRGKAVMSELGGFFWNDGATELWNEARREASRLLPIERGMTRFQQAFPALSATIGQIAIAMFGALVGGFVGYAFGSG
jgi:hypothetical protein